MLAMDAKELPKAPILGRILILLVLRRRLCKRKKGFGCALFMQMELLACRNELDWLMRWHHCAVDSYLGEYWTSRHLSVPPNYIITAVCQTFV